MKQTKKKLPEKDYKKASIPMLSNWSKEGDEVARQQLLKLCRLERKMNITVKLVKPSIEQRKFDEFMRKFKDGKFGTQRLGQAFYNEFNLHRIDDQESLHNLYAKDGEHAINSIKEIFTFN